MDTLRKNAEDYLNSLLCSTYCKVTEEWGFRQAVVGGRLDMVKCFMVLSPHSCPIQWGFETAVERGYTNIVAYFISMGSRGHCYIVSAANNGHLDIVKLLVDNGANCRFLNDWPLCLAARGGYLSIVEYLISRGSDASVDNYLPLRWSSSADHMEIVKFLVLNGSPNTLITPRQRRYISFCLEMQRKKRERAQKKIYFWWIERCYDLERAVGKRMMLKNLLAFEMLVDRFTSEK